MLASRTTGGIVSINLVTGGSGYVDAPTVALTGGGGTGATAVCHMAGTRVESVVIVNQGTGYTADPTITLSAATGSGAEAEARVYSGALRPMTFFQGRFGDVYGVDGMGRGIRWDNAATTAEQIGINKPAVAPAVTAGTTVGKYVRDITLVRQGGGYVSEPTVTISGGSAEEEATGRAIIQGGRVVGVRLTDRGRKYQEVPTVTFSGGIGEAPDFNVGLSGRVFGVTVFSGGTGYSRVQSITGAGAIAVTSATSSNYISSTTHGFTNDDAFYFASISGSTDLTANTTYYAVSVNDTQFQAATTTGGTGITLTNAITEGYVVDPSRHLYINIPYHGLLSGSTVTFSNLVGGTGLSDGVRYYARSIETGRFKVVAASTGTTPEAFTSDIVTGLATIPPPRIVFGTQYGLPSSGDVWALPVGLTAQAAPNAVVSIADGKISNVNVLYGGTGATSNSTAAIIGGGGTGATVTPDMRYRVASITGSTSGSGFYAAPVITIRPAEADTIGGGAAATAAVNSDGQITGVTVLAGGEYAQLPEAVILDTSAEATAELTSSIKGKYVCALRYIDDTSRTRKGPITSSISDITEIDIPDGVGAIDWSFTHTAVDDRVYAVELWRTTADQASVLFRVATILKTDSEWTNGYEDDLSDPELIDAKRQGYGLLPFVLSSGQVNARRQGVPPGNFAVAVVFQDRAWYAVDTSGDRPNSLLYSEIDEPESVPAVNELVVQQNSGTPDQIKALIPLSTDLLIAQDAHLYKLSYVAQPVIDAAITLVGYRGILNDRCWTVMGGVAFLADSHGVYAFDGSQEQPVSVVVDNYWRDEIIDMSVSDAFHMSSDFATKTIRFHYCRVGETLPTRALCYCVVTEAWWEETYPQPVTASATTLIRGQYTSVKSAGGVFLRDEGVVDQTGAGVDYRFKTGNMALTDDKQQSRSVQLVYKPTAEESNLKLRLYYNNSDTPRNSVISSDRGDGFVASGTSESSLNMQLTRSALGDANGLGRAYFSGRNDTRSAGGDRHLAVELAGTQAGTTGSAVTIFGVAVEGVS